MWTLLHARCGPPVRPSLGVWARAQAGSCQFEASTSAPHGPAVPTKLGEKPLRPLQISRHCALGTGYPCGVTWGVGDDGGEAQWEELVSPNPPPNPLSHVPLNFT